MTTRQWFAASFLVIAGSVTFILIFAYTGLLMYQVAFQEPRFPEETSVAGVDISNMDREEAIDAVNISMEERETDSYYAVTWFDMEVPVPPEAVNFSVESTIDEVMESGRTETDLAVTVNHGRLEEALSEFFYNNNAEGAVRTEELAAALEEEAGTLPEDGISLMLHPYLIETERPQEVYIHGASRSGIVTPGVEEILGSLSSVTIESKSNFSLLEELDLSAGDLVEEEVLAAISSAVFETVASTNFAIEERHQRHALLDIVPAGFDAHIAVDAKDFQFYNPNDYNYELEVSTNGSDLEVSLYGYEFPYNIEVAVEETDRLGTERRIIYTKEGETASSDMSSFSNTETEEEISGDTVEAGEEGFRVETVRTISYAGDLEESAVQLLAEDYYAPFHVLEERDINVREPEEEEPADEFPWQEDQWNGNGGMDQEDYENWMNNGGGDDFEDWLDEGSPGNYDQWLEENGREESSGFEFDRNNGFDFGSGTGNGYPGYDGGPGGGFPGYDGGNGPGGGFPGYGGSNGPGNGYPGYDGGAGPGFPGYDGSNGTGSGFPGYDGGSGTQPGGFPGYDDSGNGSGFPGYDGGTGEGFPGYDGAGPGSGFPGYGGSNGSGGEFPGYNGDTGESIPGYHDGAGTGNGVPGYGGSNGTGDGFPGGDSTVPGGYPGYNGDGIPGYPGGPGTGIPGYNGNGEAPPVKGE
ncbi:VanW family protein [Alkalicoccus daliensis]|uniref:VanW like protein n=1 Tax=Alkalicoccus daliensis TaxID=745820 RepID=A0A1H0CLQ7_9BACI|nr:VanW family protein [Alkalicoccus daliensis]SDN58789.1 VanW like protein [Alkalicoccus daliensis]